MKRIWKKITGSALTLPLVVLAAVGGNRLWMNIRPHDPLPARFEEYSPEAFQAAQAAGRTIMVDVYAVWCPTCKAQHKTLRNLLDDPRYQSIVGFRVDFDVHRDFLRAHQVRGQSTILMFHGDQELSRSMGVTSEGMIRAQVDAALAQVAAPRESPADEPGA